MYLESVEISNYRGLNDYKVSGLSNWVALTGPNSSNKSALISAISILGSSKLHDFADIPAAIKGAIRNVPVKITYTFRLNQGFDRIIGDDRLQNFLVASKKQEIERRKPLGTAEDYVQTLEREIYHLKEKTLRQAFYDALYDTIKKLLAKGIDHSEFKCFLFSEYGIKGNVEEVLESAHYLKIELEMTLSDGPNYELLLLDANKEPIVSSYLFFHWIQETHITNTIELPDSIGAVFIKSVLSRPLHDESHEEKRDNLPPITLASDYSNLEAYIKHCLNCYPEVLENVSKDFERIFDSEISFKMPQPNDFSESTKTLVKIKDSDWFPLERLSDGMFSAFKILLQLNSCRDGDILIIDEPELHLHPGAAKMIRELLNERKNNTQFIVSTHSPIFIDPFYVNTLILHHSNEEPEILSSNEIDEALIALGSSGSDALLYDVVIWYEGPSDKVYLEALLRLYASQIKIQPASIGLMHFGGGKLEYIEPKIIKKIAHNSILVIDSDKKSDTDTLTPEKQQFVSDCKKDNATYWVTDRREIENYIPIDILRSVAADTTLVIGPYDDVFEKLQRKNKVKLAKLVAPQITMPLIQKDVDFDKEFKANIVDVLNSFK